MPIRGVGMVGAERLLADRQRPRAERPGAFEVALGLQQGGEVVEAHGGREFFAQFAPVRRPAAVRRLTRGRSSNSNSGRLRKK
jgi:hypothetical protein